MNKEIKHILELYNQKRYKIISERMMEVDNQLVVEHIKSGRIILTCSCANHGRFQNNTLCRHKRFYLNYPIINELYKKIDKLIKFYELQKGIKSKFEADVFLEDLKNLKDSL